MASEIELRVVAPQPGAAGRLEQAADRIRAVARHLTRFEETSALSRANAAPSAWHEVPPELAAAVERGRAGRTARRAACSTRGCSTHCWGGVTTGPSPGTARRDPTALPSARGRVPTSAAHPVPDEPWEPTVLPGRAGS